MNFVEIYLQIFKERRTGAIEASTGKKRWIFYFLEGNLAITKSNLKQEQTAALKESEPTLSASELVLLQAKTRIQKACLAEETKERDVTADKNLNISALDALTLGIAEAYSDEDLLNLTSEIHDLRPELIEEISFEDGEIVAFISSLTGTLRSPVAVSNSGVPSGKAWAALWVLHLLDALKKDETEPEESITDLLNFDLDSLLEQEVAKEDIPESLPEPEENSENEVQESEQTKEEQMRDTIEELEAKILEAENHFEVLHVSHEVDPEEFRKSFRDLSMRLHPDRFIDANEETRERATVLFDKVREAYEVLSDDEKREKYINQAIHGQLSEEDQAMEQLEAYWKADAAFNKGKTLFNQGQISRAHPYFAEAAEASPETLEFVAYYGYTSFSVNRNTKPEEAVIGLETLKKVLELNKEQEIKLDSAWTLMGRAYREKGESEKAIRALKQALRINPSNPDATREMKRLISKNNPTKKEKKKEKKAGFFSKFFGGGKK
jgi:curved DNA-binding protein CbpA